MKYLLLALGLSCLPALAQTSEPNFDGIVEKEEWATAQEFLINYEIDPGNNTLSENLTEVYVTYSQTHLYIGFIAYTDMNTLRSSIRNRDEAWQDDFVMFGLDTYGDGRYLINFGANAEGNQVDMKLSASGNDDESYDINFESKASKHEKAYHVELKIPFNVLQFKKNATYKWNIILYRSTYTGDNRSQNLDIAIDRNNNCLPCQTKNTISLKNIKPENRLLFTPNLVGSWIGEKIKGALSYGDLEAGVGLSGLLDLNNTTSLEYTINPDFSQVEADVSQVTVNNTFAVEFPERRPYFNEGNDLIASELNTVYTRAINKPLFSTKLISQGDRDRIYWLTAYDKASPYLIAGENQSVLEEGGASYANILKYQRTFKGGSNIGFLTTNRFFTAGGSGNTLGINALYRMKEKYTIAFEYSKSLVQEPNADWVQNPDFIKEKSVALDGESLKGAALALEVTRNTKNWNSKAFYEQYSPHYQTPLGFITRNSIRRVFLGHGYQHFFEKENKVKQLNIFTGSEMIYNYDGLKKYSTIGGDLSIQLAGNLNMTFEKWIVLHEEYEGFNAKNMSENNFFIRFSPSENINMSVFTSWGESIYYNDIPAVGKNFYIGAFNNFQLSPKWSVIPSVRYSKLSHLDKKNAYYEGCIIRSNTNYQFNQNLSLRLVSELNSFNKGAFVQTLLKWNPNPFTIFYIGGTNGYSYTERLGNLGVDGINFYFKFQYQFGL
jgi:hypothetical protein